METMAVESLLSALWELQGFLTKTRVSFPVNSGYSDMDVVGLKGATLRIGECKARYSPNTVMVVNENIKNFYSDWLGSWGNFSNRLNEFWDAEYEWLPNKRDLKKVELWFCGNIFFQNTRILTNAEKMFKKGVRDRLPHGLKNKTSVKLLSTFDAIINTIKELKVWVEEEKWGKRFGDPILDTLRELNRYLSCTRAEGGESIVTSEDIRQTSKEKLKYLFSNT